MNRIEVILQNVKEMLEQRGDNINLFTEALKTYSANSDYSTFFDPKNKDNFNVFYTNKTAIIFALTNDMRKAVFDLMKSTKKNENLSVEDIVKNIVEKHNNMTNFILIISPERTLNIPEKTLITQIDKQLQKAGGMFQEFYYTNFLFNPTKHILVPSHRKMDNNEVKLFMENYMIKSKTNMPYILKTDPIARWYGLKTGDIVEITHNNINSGISYYYRCCV